MLPLGCSTYAAADSPLEEALEAIRIRTGLIEILSDGQHDLLAFGEACLSFDAAYTVHAPCCDINIASSYGRIREGSIAVLEDVCRICGEIGARLLTVHPGHAAWDGMTRSSLQALAQSLSDLSTLQEAYGIPIAVENMGSWECCHFRTPSLLELLADHGLGHTLDIGHAHLNGTLDAFLNGSCPPASLHLHDNDGKSDLHHACGSGTIGYRELLDCLPRNVPWIIEVQSLDAYDRSAAYLGSLLREEHILGEDRPC